MDRSDVLYLKNALLIDGTGASPLRNAGLLIRGDTIERVVPAAESSLVPGEAEVLDLGGRTLMPGLFEMHVHLCFPTRTRGLLDTHFWEQPEKTAIRAALNARTLLMAGFTTIRDVGCRGRSAMAVRDAINEGLLPGPRVFASGRNLSTSAGMADRYPTWLHLEGEAESSWIVDGVDEIVKATRLLLKEGVDTIKLGISGGEVSPFLHSWENAMSYEEAAAAVREANRAGKTVAAHAQANESIRIAVRAGVTTVEHATYLDRETALAMRDQGTFVVPTIACIFGWLEKGPSTGANAETLEEMRINKEPWINSIRLAADLGVKIANGADLGNRYPHGEQAREFELLVEKVGLSPMEVIVAATKTSAEAARISDQTGTLEAGKLADLLVVKGDSSRDISVLRDLNNLQMILKEGVVYKNSLEAAHA